MTLSDAQLRVLLVCQQRPLDWIAISEIKTIIDCEPGDYVSIPRLMNKGWLEFNADIQAIKITQKGIAEVAKGAIPIKPALPHNIRVNHPRPYQGAIEPGMIFIWEPTLPYGRELCVVTRIAPPHPSTKWGWGKESVVWTRSLLDGKEVYNDFDRFREAAVLTNLTQKSE